MIYKLAKKVTYFGAMVVFVSCSDSNDVVDLETRFCESDYALCDAGVAFTDSGENRLEIAIRFEDRSALFINLAESPLSLPSEIRLADTTFEQEKPPWAVWIPDGSTSTFNEWASSGETIKISFVDNAFIEMEFDLELLPFAPEDKSVTKPISGKIRAPVVSLDCWDIPETDCTKYDQIRVSPVLPKY